MDRGAWWATVHGVRKNHQTWLSDFTFTAICRLWRRQWYPTPVLLPGESHGRRSLVGCSHGVAKSRTRLSNFTFTFHLHASEKETATHSSVLAWRITGTGDPGELLSMGSHRVRHNWSDLAAAAYVDCRVAFLSFNKKSSLNKFFFGACQKYHGFSNKTYMVLLKSCVMALKTTSMVSGDLGEKISQPVFSAILSLLAL